MAAFMQRVGRVVGMQVSQSGGGFLAGPPGLPAFQPTLCSMPTIPTAVTEDTRAYLDAVVSLLSDETWDAELQLVVSLNGGTTWQAVHALGRSATLRAGLWERVGLSGDVDVPASSAPLFNVSLRSAPPLQSVRGANCKLRYRLQARGDLAMPIPP
jgi:hypothetical protein